MTTNNRYPIVYTLLAGFAGAIAWGLPYPIEPFLSHIPLMPRFPIYESAPFKIQLAEFIIAYILGGIIASGLFAFGVRSLPINRERYSRPSLSPLVVLSLMAGMALGGALAILVGLVISSSPAGIRLATALGFDFGSIEPYLSIGWILGTALTTILIGLFSGVMKQHDAPIQTTLKIALRVSGVTFLVRLILCFVEYSSFAKYAYGDSIFVFMLFQVVGGALFGLSVWTLFSRLCLDHQK